MKGLGLWRGWLRSPGLCFVEHENQAGEQGQGGDADPPSAGAMAREDHASMFGAEGSACNTPEPVSSVIRERAKAESDLGALDRVHHLGNGRVRAKPELPRHIDSFDGVRAGC